MISPDGERIAEQVGAGPDAGRIELQDGNGRRIRLIGTPEDEKQRRVLSMALSTGGARLAVLWVSPSDGTSVIRVWDTSGDNVLLDLKAGGPTMLAISEDGEWITAPVGGGAARLPGVPNRITAIRVVNVADGKEVRSFALNLPADICSAAFSPDRKHLLTVAQQVRSEAGEKLVGRMSAQLWDVASGREVQVPRPDFPDWATVRSVATDRSSRWPIRCAAGVQSISGYPDRPKRHGRGPV